MSEVQCTPVQHLRGIFCRPNTNMFFVSVKLCYILFGSAEDILFGSAELCLLPQTSSQLCLSLHGLTIVARPGPFPLQS